MITNEKHFTKCETPNSSKIIEDKKYNSSVTNAPTVNKMTNGITNEIIKNGKITNDTKEMKMDENKVTSTTETKVVNGSVTDEKPDSDDPNNPFNAPKYGTVIPNRIFVGGFSAKTADEDLWRFFSSFCHITAAKIIYDRAGVSKCYGFVTFANPKDAKTIVKQHAGVMHSPMGRLRIAQAVRKQIPMFPVDMEGAAPPPPQGATHYYHPLPPQLQHKAPPVCIPITSYIPITQNHISKYPPHPPPTQSVSPHDSSSVTPESTSTVGGTVVMQHTLHNNSPQVQGNQQLGPVNNNNIGGAPGGKVIRYAAPPAGGPVAMQQQGRPPSVPAPPPQAATNAQPTAMPHMYATPQGGMIPQYVIPAVAYPQSLPAYDATGLYTTCPGYTTYPSYVMMAPPSYPHPAAPPMGAMMPAYHPAQPPIMNSYIY